MRFDSAREAGLTEDRVARIDDGYAANVAADEAAALALTDAIVGVQVPLDQAQIEAQIAGLRAHFSDAQIAELALGVSLFLGMSKVLICLGLEPAQMDTTVLPTPGS